MHELQRVEGKKFMVVDKIIEFMKELEMIRIFIRIVKSIRDLQLQCIFFFFSFFVTVIYHH